MQIRPTTLAIDCGALRHNITSMKAVAGSAKVLAVVKANGYGHGAVQSAKAALAAGAQMLAVALIEEGIELRDAGIDAPILMLGHTNGSGAFAAVEYGITTVIFTPEMLLALEGAAKSLGVTAYAHIKLDTGMNRIGVRTPQELNQLLDTAAQCPHVRITGVMTHFATADIPDSDFGCEQMDRFEALVKEVEHRGLTFIRHAAASAGAVRYPRARYDMIRAGIAMYGVDALHTLQLRPAMRWTTRIVHLKTICAGDTVSYGRRYTATADTVIATLPVGYADGYRRAFSSKAHVLVGGIRVPVLGTVCMDQIMVDVTGLDVHLNDEVVLMGSQMDGQVTCEELAQLADTIPYEIMTGISARVPRVYVNE